MGWVWTEQRATLLEERWSRGWSAGRIAAELGTTRSSVCGKMKRLGLNSVSRPRGPSEIVATPGGRALRYVVAPVMPPITLMQLGTESCRWPVGVPGGAGSFFCGAPRSGGCPYCAHHAARAYRSGEAGEG